MQNKAFYERYASLFVRVCAVLGEGWRVDTRVNEYFIHLINPNFRNYYAFIREEKGRLIIRGGVKNVYGSFGFKNACSVAPTRSPAAIAGDIKRKVLCEAAETVKEAQTYQTQKETKKHNAEIVRDALGRLVRVSNGHQPSSWRIETEKKISGRVHEGYRGYHLELSGLTADDLIKIAGCLS
ncbi:MAG: hypothetical protein ACRC4K_13220, partial [Plesiomonas shigelloides]